MRGLDPRIYQITRRWMLRPRWMLRATPTSLLDVLVEKIHGALPGGLGARFMEAPPLVAMEAVPRARIDVNLAVTTTLFLDRLDVSHRDRRILVAKMHLRGYLRLLIGILGGFFGVGGSFIAGPALRLVGLDWNFAVGTDLAHIVGKSVVAAKRHRALGKRSCHPCRSP